MLIVAFMLVFGDAITRASGNAKVVNLASNLAAFVLFACGARSCGGSRSPMAVTNVAGACTGAHLAIARGDQLIRVIVLAVVVALIVKIGVSLVAP